MSQTGKCTNYAGCVRAYRGEEITVAEGPFVCPECGSPLEAGGGRGAGPAGPGFQGNFKNVLIAAGTGLGLVVILSILAVVIASKRSATTDEEVTIPSTAEVEPAEAPPAANAPSAAGPSVARAEPAHGTAGAPPAPRPAPAASLPEMPRAAAKPNLDLASRENQNVKAEVLKRIDLMPSISADNKDRLYVSVERARQMGRLVTIPFGSGKMTIGSTDVEALRREIGSPQLQSLLQDPTAVFVILGFADTKGDEKKNLEISEQRARHVLNVLREKCSVLNVMHAVGMGGSTMFDPEGTEKNRVVEIWVVLP